MNLLRTPQKSKRQNPSVHQQLCHLDAPAATAVFKMTHSDLEIWLHVRVSSSGVHSCLFLWTRRVKWLQSHYQALRCHTCRSQLMDAERPHEAPSHPSPLRQSLLFLTPKIIVFIPKCCQAGSQDGIQTASDWLLHPRSAAVKAETEPPTDATPRLIHPVY